MLLCAKHHKLIDDHPADYSRQTLAEYKRAHQARIRHVTSLGPDRKTAVLVFRALVGGQNVAIPFSQIYEATAPRYPVSRDPVTIDLTTLRSDDQAYYRSASAAIKEHVKGLFEPNGEATRAGHVSVFALAPMPLLMCLGRALTNKVSSDLYQRHRDTETWTWKMDGTPARYALRRVKAGGLNHVALVLSLSGKIRVADLPLDTLRTATVYELTLVGQPLTTTFLRQRQDLEAFRVAYQEALGRIISEHGLLGTIDCFPAVPAPIAVLCGRELLPKVHPQLRVYDYDRATGGFHFKLKV
jgi:hypothetical protein